MALWSGTETEKKEFKKAIAKMMVFWVIQTRHSLRAELIANDPDKEWLETGLDSVFADDRSEWTVFFSRVSAHYQQSHIKDAAEETNELAHGEWVLLSATVPDCPPNTVIREMFDRAMDFVDAEWTLTSSKSGS